MTNSQPSRSEPTSFDMLDPRIQHWIWRSGWTELRDAQDRAIPVILEGKSDVVIAASTASGKTEAAFFPILTRLGQCSDPLALALYVSPLKALINDQWRRLDELAEALKIEVTPWHGDIPYSRKKHFLANPGGCLLITPESLEAMLCRHGHALSRVFQGLQYVVVDELHAFIGTERGMQLLSLLHRVETLIGRPVMRIGLSATLGDMTLAKKVLRQDGNRKVALIESKSANQELKVLVKGFVEPAKLTLDQSKTGSPARAAVAQDIFDVLRGTNNLVFPNSRDEVEYYSDRLRRMCEEQGFPNEFWPHHGNLSKGIREEAEAALKQTERPATAICTSTLELGIDIGPVRSVVQVGPPPSVASLRQRLGRSGRRPGEPMILRAACIEKELGADSGLSIMLREGLLTTVAMIRLLARGWCEPVSRSQLHASTLVQQILSVLAQYGGAHAQQLWGLLVTTGPFSAVSAPQFGALLQKLRQTEIIFQDPTGLILLAPKGEAMTQHYSFYAAFSTDDEYTIVSGHRTLGSVPLSRPLYPGGFLIFAGRRWQVISVSEDGRIVQVNPAGGGNLPGFEGALGAVLHVRVREEMRAVLRSSEAVPFLDAVGQRLLAEARETYARYDLDKNWLLQLGSDVHILLWTGDRINNTLALALQTRGLKAASEGLSVAVKDISADEARGILLAIGREQIDPIRIADGVQNKIREKWDGLLPNDLLDACYASANIDVPGLQKALRGKLNCGPNVNS